MSSTTVNDGTMAGREADGACCSPRVALAAILLAGAALRLGLAMAFGGHAPVITDAQDYNRLAVDLAETGAYADEAGRLISMRPPLFPAVAAAIYSLVGSENYLAVSLFHAAISLLTVWLAYQLGVEVYSPRVGVVAAAIVACYPTLLAYNQLFLSEVLFTFFVTAGALLTVRVARTGKLAVALCLGLCLGLGALTRSVLWLFAPVLAVAVSLLGSTPWPRRLGASALMLMAFGAVIAPWAWRNTKLHQTLTIVDVMGGRNVMMGNYEYTPLERSWATIESQTGDRSWHAVLATHTPGYYDLTQGQRDKAAMKYGIRYFFANPWESLQRSAVKFFNFWQLERDLVAGMRSGLFGTQSISATVAVGLVVCGAYALTLFGAIFGVCMVPPPRRADLWLLALWIAFPCALHTIAFAHSRYHVPLIPIVAVFAAASFTQGRDVLSHWRSKRFAGASLACTVVVASWVREFVMVDLKWFQ